MPIRGLPPTMERPTRYAAVNADARKGMSIGVEQSFGAPRSRGKIRTFLHFEAVLNVSCKGRRGPREKRHYFPWEEVPQGFALPRMEPIRPRPNPVSLAREWQLSMREHSESRSELARRLDVSRGRVTQVLGILDLAPDVLDLLEAKLE